MRRAELNAALSAAGEPQKISFTHLIAYAIVQAAHDVPGMTHRASAARTASRRASTAGSISVLPSTRSAKTDRAFLIVPVIKAADTLDFVAFRDRYEDLSRKRATTSSAPKT